MDESPNPYRPPGAALEQTAVPAAFTASGYSAGYFRLAFWCLVASMVISFIDGVFHAWSGEAVAVDPQWSALVLGVPSTALACFALLALGKLLKYRMDHDRSNGIIVALIVFAVLQVLTGPFLAVAETVTDWPWVLFGTCLFIGGVLSIWLGIRIVRLPRAFSQSRLFGWSCIISGIFFATVVLFALGALVGLVSSIALLLMFRQAIAELTPTPGARVPPPAEGTP